MRIKPGDCRGGATTRRQSPDELGRPTWAPGCRSVAVGALFPYSDRYREGLNQLLLYSFESGSWSQSVLFPQHSAGNRESGGPVWSPNGTHMAFVTEGRLWTVAVDGEGGAIGPPDVIADDQPESPSWEGDSRHIVYQTPKGLRRVLADGSPPRSDRARSDLAGRAAAGARRRARRTRLRRRPRSAARRIGHRRSSAASSAASKATATSCMPATVVDASDETVMPGLIEMHAHLDDGYGGSFGRIWLAYGITERAHPVDQSVRRRSSSARRSTPAAGPARACSSRAIRSTARASTTPAASRSTSDEQLEQELDRASALGVDFFKTYVRLPDRHAEAHRRLRARARQAGDVARDLSGDRVRHRRRRAPARHEPARLFAES